MEWRRRFAEYEAALEAHVRAQGFVDQLQGRLDICTSDCESAALKAGVAMARRRAILAGRELVMATDSFRQGCSVLEAIWSAPDDL